MVCASGNVVCLVFVPDEFKRRKMRKDDGNYTVRRTEQEEDKAVLCRLKFLVQNCEKSVVVSDVNMPR